MSTLRCLIIEDEKPAADLLKDYLEKIPGTVLIGCYADILSASEALNDDATDLVFLDINLPHLSGIDYLRNNRIACQVIITTAYENYAVEGYSLNVTDYLLKPFSFERFVSAVTKAKKNKSQESSSAVKDSFFFVKSDKGLERIEFDEILFIEALLNYITIQTASKKVITYSSLKSIESFLPSSRFVRVQKSFLVSIEKIDRIDGDNVIIAGRRISISRTNKEAIINRIINDRFYNHREGN